MKLSKAAISTLIKEMLSAGLLEESIPESNGQGRPSVLLKMRADSAYFLGASLLGDDVYLVLTDMHGRIRQYPHAAESRSCAAGWCAGRRHPGLLAQKASPPTSLSAGRHAFRLCG